jgi:hypothetical protein
MYFMVSSSGAIPWAAYSAESGYYVTWQYLTDALHLRRVALSGVPTSDTVSLMNTSASITPKLSVNGHYGAVVWEDKLSNTIDFLNTLIEGAVFPLDSINSASFFECNDDFKDAIRTHPDVVFIDDTTLAVVWDGNGSQTPFQSGIYAQLTSINGNPRGGNFLVTDHTQSGTNNVEPRVISQPNSGSFIVTWVDNSRGSNRIFGRKFDSNGIPQAPSFLISDDSVMTYMFFYGVAQDTSGGFVAAWIADRDTVSRIEWRWYDRNGMPVSGVQFVTGDSKLISSGNCIDVSIDEQNRTVLAWEQNTLKGYKIFGQAFRSDKSSFVAPFRISIDTTAIDELFPKVILRNNTIFTVWQASGINGSNLNFTTITSVPVNTKWGSSARAFELLASYPNPFNPSTTISFRINKSANVKLSVYSLLGEEVAALLETYLAPNMYRITWEGKDLAGRGLASGIYVVRLAVGDEFTSQKIILLR